MIEDIRPLYDAVRKVAPSAIIAGGVVRDMVFERPIKDIDLWVNAPEFYEAQQVVQNSLPNLINEYTSEYENLNREIVVAQEWQGDTLKVPVNLIGIQNLPPVEELIQTFDFGLCRVAFTPDLNVLTSTDFLRDGAQKTFTLLLAKNVEQFSKSLDRYRRLQEKYPEYSLTLPPEVAKFVGVDDPLSIF